jgi:excinuclease ABC subunit B
VDNLLGWIRKRVARNERVLVTTLTKRMAEDLAEYYTDLGLKVQYMHSDIKTIDRVQIIRDLRLGVFDVLVGINLLREGLDLPEVSLVAILDADKEGFLRSERSLIQTCGRAARNINGTVLLYADTITGSMQRAIDECNRRRQIQMDYNQANHITPVSIRKNIGSILESAYEADYVTVPAVAEKEETYATPEELDELIARLRSKMQAAAGDLDFEEAARLRDQIKALEAEELHVAGYQ